MPKGWSQVLSNRFHTTGGGNRDFGFPPAALSLTPFISRNFGMESKDFRRTATDGQMEKEGDTQWKNGWQ
jgi:hypothetical protein